MWTWIIVSVVIVCLFFYGVHVLNHTYKDFIKENESFVYLIGILIVLAFFFGTSLSLIFWELELNKII